MNILNKQIGIIIRRIIFITLGSIDILLGRKPHLFILCYHAVGNDKWRYSVSKNEIEKQVRYLLSKFENVTLADVENHIRGNRIISKPSFVLTFDDGYEDIYNLKDLFEKLEVFPTVFILADSKRANHAELENTRPFLNTKQLLSLRKSGWDIQSHGMTHAFLPTSKELDIEIIGAYKKILKDLKIKAKYFAYPKGGYTNKVLAVMTKSNYSMAVSMDDGIINQSTNIYAVPRIGVDKSHTFSEFKYIFSPLVTTVRGFIKNTKII